MVFPCQQTPVGGDGREMKLLVSMAMSENKGVDCLSFPSSFQLVEDMEVTHGK